jgi:two-component system CheB/CheR fusion protein
MPADTIFRAWIPGCSTGEEVYSLAIILHEIFDKDPRRSNLQLFGTDIDSYAMDFAVTVRNTLDKAKYET